jgi:hypothetical protein
VEFSFGFFSGWFFGLFHFKTKWAIVKICMSLSPSFYFITPAVRFVIVITIAAVESFCMSIHSLKCSADCCRHILD